MLNQKKFSASRLLIHLIFILLSLMCIVPLVIILSISLTSESVLMAEGYSLLPKDFTIYAYQYVLSGASSVVRAYGVTIFVTVVGTFIHLFTTAMLAYALTRKEVTARNKISLFVFFPVLFSGGLVPYYILMIKVLKLKNTVWALIAAGVVSPMNVIIMKNFFKTIPESLIESARIDGSNEYRTLFQIVMPLSKPSLATISLFTAIGYWNNWMQCSLFIETPKLYTLQYLLQSLMNNIKYLQANAGNIKGMENALLKLPSEGARMATCILSIGPIVLLYPLIQKYFEKGLTIGAVKE
ncbi:MAG: carbohydrate ABC transporter permease [Faecousia sp.]